MGGVQKTRKKPKKSYWSKKRPFCPQHIFGDHYIQYYKPKFWIALKIPIFAGDGPFETGTSEFCNLERPCANPDEKCHVFFEKFYYEAGYCGTRHGLLKPWIQD